MGNKKITFGEEEFEKELETLDFNLQEKIKIFKNVTPKPSTRKDIEFYLEAKDIAKIRKQLSTDLSDKTIYTYLGIERRTFSLLRDDGLKILNSNKEQKVPKIKEKKEKTNETNENNETAILKRLDKIKEQNDKLISFYELSKKRDEENENEFDDSEKEDLYDEDADILENPEKQLRSFRVNSWMLKEFVRVAKKRDMKVQTATNKAFRMFIEKYE